MPCSAGFGVSDRFFTHPLTQGVLQLRLLDEQIVLGPGRIRRLGAFK